MPPKKKKAETAKSKAAAKKDGVGSSDNANTMTLRKNPKKKSLKSEDAAPAKVRKTRKTKSKPEKAKKKAVVDDKDQDDDAVSLSPRDSDDQFSSEESGQNASSNATALLTNEGEIEEKGREETEQINQQVSAALDRYFRSKKGKKHKKKRKRRRAHESPSSSDTDSDSVTSDSESGGSSDSSPLEDEERQDRGRKRKRKEKRRKDRRSKRGESRVNSLVKKTPSVSTVYTRGCKSPQNAVFADSSNESLDGGNIPSDGNIDEVLESLNTSRDRSTPYLDRRRDGSRSPDGRTRERRRHHRDQRGSPDHGDDERNARYQEQADAVVRELHQNKSDLAKPSGEYEKQLQSLLRNFKHFHLTSHVDKKLKERIKECDFTVDFRRLLPRSRARDRYDNRMQVVHSEGNTYFIPADDKEVKEIVSYKVWEVAFKIFMGIFNQFWPEHMNELLQYSHIIQTASLNHSWEAVYNYDISFREIMSEQPQTHWGVISQQTWTLELGDNSARPMPPVAAGGLSTKKSGTNQKNPCWKFNKGRCT